MSKIKYYSISVLAVIMLATACSENNEGEITPQITEQNTFSFKDLTIYDATGKYHVNLRIGANNESLLNEFNKENYQLLINPSLATSSIEDLGDLTLADEVEEEEIISTEYLGHNFDSFVESYRVIYEPNSNPNGRDGWACKKRTYWEKSYGADKAYVKNKNGVNRFNVAVYYMLSHLSHNVFSGYDWGSIEQQIDPWTLKSTYDMPGKGDSKTTTTCAEEVSFGMAVRLKSRKCAKKEITFYDLGCGE